MFWGAAGLASASTAMRRPAGTILHEDFLAFTVEFGREC
jgi:hypothetical protein